MGPPMGEPAMRAAALNRMAPRTQVACRQIVCSTVCHSKLDPGHEGELVGGCSWLAGAQEKPVAL